MRDFIAVAVDTELVAVRVRFYGGNRTVAVRDRSPCMLRRLQAQDAG